MEAGTEAIPFSRFGHSANSNRANAATQFQFISSAIHFLLRERFLSPIIRHNSSLFVKMALINPCDIIEANTENPVSFDVPWTADDFVNKDLLHRVLHKFESLGRPSSHFFVVAAELRLPLYDELAKEPVDWCIQPVALGIEYVQWHLIRAVCSYLKWQLLTGDTCRMAPPSSRGPADYAYTARFTFVEARSQAERRSQSQRVAQRIQQRLADVRRSERAAIKKTAENAGPSIELPIRGKPALSPELTTSATFFGAPTTTESGYEENM